MGFGITQHSWGTDEPITGPTDLAALVFNDPPYNIGIEYADDPTGDNVPMDQYQRWVRRTIAEQSVLLRPGGTFWWMCPESHGDFVGPLLTEFIGPRLHRVVWYETFAQYQNKCLTADYRFIFCHTKRYPNKEDDTRKWNREGLTFNPEAILIPSARQEKYNDKRAVSAGRVPGQVWQVRRLQGTSDDHVDWHNAQLPPELLDRIIRGWSNPGDFVIDGFCGSGNMGLSALRNKRVFVGFDQSPTYVAKIRERLTPFSL